MARPASLVTGRCTGHGVCVPGAVHGAYPCGTPCPGSTLPLATKNGTCFWPPLVTAPLAPVPKTVLVNGIIPLADGDALILHRSPCTNIIMVGPCGDASPKPIPCSCSVLTAEDAMGAGHPRIVKALTTSVFVNGRRFAAVGDPLGPPCLSTIASGSSNVFVGL
jgi:hypothetical protein